MNQEKWQFRKFAKEMGWQNWCWVVLAALVAGVIGGVISAQFFIKKEWEFVSLLSVAGAVGAALGALVTALATNQAAKAMLQNVEVTRKTLEAQIIVGLHRDYASPEMGFSLKTLHSWKTLQDEEGKDFKEEFIRMKKKNIYHPIDDHRRRVSHYASLVRELRRKEIIDKDIYEKILLQKTTMDFLEEIVDELDNAMQEDRERGKAGQSDQEKE